MACAPHMLSRFRHIAKLRWQRRRSHLLGAFTLLELLVVLTILALLIALLMPVLQDARMVARTAACQSNLRQLGFAFAMFVHDNDGYAPGKQWFRPYNHRPIDSEPWPYAMLPGYIKSGYGSSQWWGLLHCPDLDEHDLAAAANRGHQYWGRTYGYNTNWWEAAATRPMIHWNEPIERHNWLGLRLEQARAPSRTLTFADAAGAAIWNTRFVGDFITARHAQLPGATAGVPGGYGLIEGRVANLAMADGHVEGQTYAKRWRPPDLLAIDK